MEEGSTAAPPRPPAPPPAAVPRKAPSAPAPRTAVASPAPPKPAAPKPASNASSPAAAPPKPALPTPAPSPSLPAAPRPASSAALPSVPAGPTAGTSERRKHARFKPEGVTARFAKGGFLAKVGLGTIQARVFNISEGGVLLLGKMRFSEGAQIALRIEIPSHQDEIVCDAHVRWCSQSAKSESEFYVGLAFVGLKAVDEKKIAKMREWFTSAQFKARSSTRLRRLPDGGKP